MSSKDLSYDKQEQTALAMAVETLTREREARKIHRRTRGAEA